MACKRKADARWFEDYHLRVGEITVDTAPPTGRAVKEQRRRAAG